jgi:protein SCO1/2
MAFAIFEPIQVLPRIRLSPGFALVDQSGASLTSDDLRGEVVLYGFAYGDCGEACDSTLSTMEEVARRVPTETDLGDVPFRVVTISLDPARDTERLGTVAERSGADGETWRWATAEPDELRRVAGNGFKVPYERSGDEIRFDPRFVLVDGWGVVRGEYRYSTLADDADKLVRHVGILGEELRNSTGVASVAYEAAHVFLCYP